jgi:hypothetical protein
MRERLPHGTALLYMHAYTQVEEGSIVDDNTSSSVLINASVSRSYEYTYGSLFPARYENLWCIQALKYFLPVHQSFMIGSFF